MPKWPIPDVKKWLVVNESDPNEQFTVLATNENDAAFKALEKLGWFVAEGDEVENRDELEQEE